MEKKDAVRLAQSNCSDIYQDVKELEAKFYLTRQISGVIGKKAVVPTFTNIYTRL